MHTLVQQVGQKLGTDARTPQPDPSPPAAPGAGA
jgi:hypothetical protein